MYTLRGVLAVLSAMLMLDAALGVGVALAWRLLVRRFAADASTDRSLLFGLRILPSAVAILSVALLVPAYLRYEPGVTLERVGPPLVTAAGIMAGFLVHSLARSVRSLWNTRRLARRWMAKGQPAHIPGAGIPVYRVEHPFPVAAVVGILRPRLFIAQQVVEALSPAEMRAVLAHETAHISARDNLQGLLFRASGGFLGCLEAGREMEHRWKTATEAAADACVGRAGPRAALDLAAALVKIARLVPPGQALRLAHGACLLDAGMDGVAWRVQRLARLGAGDLLPRSRPLRITRLAVVPVGIVGLLLGWSHLPLLHAWMEQLVSVLS